jgi:hypothetical protein
MCRAPSIEAKLIARTHDRLSEVIYAVVDVRLSTKDHALLLVRGGFSDVDEAFERAEANAYGVLHFH